MDRKEILKLLLFFIFGASFTLGAAAFQASQGGGYRFSSGDVVGLGIFVVFAWVKAFQELTISQFLIFAALGGFGGMVLLSLPRYYQGNDLSAEQRTLKEYSKPVSWNFIKMFFIILLAMVIFFFILIKINPWNI
ncbi:MAG: hypothetical protein Q7R99_02710 [bacterium]|nr:hypothetical protein [bacterium]